MLIGINSSRGMLLALKDIPGGTTFVITDYNLDAAGNFVVESWERAFTWRAPAGGMAAGTVIKTPLIPPGSSGDKAVYIGGKGDTVYIVKDHLNSKDFIFAASFANGAANPSSFGYLPEGFVYGESALSTSARFAAYRPDAPHTGSKAEVLAAICDPANWEATSTLTVGDYSFSIN